MSPSPTCGEQEALFDAPPPDPLPKVLTGRGQEAPIWFRHKTRRRVLCDDCAQITHERWPALAPPIRQAQWKRIAGGGTRLLCTEHAAHWKEADGVD